MQTTERIGMSILPRIGYGIIRFGMSPKDIEEILGPPEQSEIYDEDGDIVFSYDSLGIDLLCFENDDSYRLTIIELSSDSHANIWDESVFECTIKELETFAFKHNRKLTKVVSSSNELLHSIFRITPLSIDFFINDNGAVENISFSVYIDDNDTVQWPE